MEKIILASATKDELDYLVSYLGGKWEEDRAIFSYKGMSFIAILTGIGLINAAMKLTLFLNDKDISAIWMLGSCGSYSPDINIGDVIIASEEINADLGIQGREGWESPENFGFHLLKTKKGSYIHRYPCLVPKNPKFKIQNSKLLDHLNLKGNFKVHVGPVLSLSTVNGSHEQANILYNRFKALGENMEGAAAAQVAAYFEKTFIEIRGVSNIAGDRNKANWNFPLALRNSQEVGLQILLKFYNLE